MQCGVLELLVRICSSVCCEWSEEMVTTTITVTRSIHQEGTVLEISSGGERVRSMYGDEQMDGKVSSPESESSNLYYMQYVQ